MNYLTYEEIQKRVQGADLRRNEIPVEHVVSLPLPTLRGGHPGYAFFAAPAVRRPGSPVQQGAPDRWGVLDARNGQALLYARCDAYSFHPGVNFETETLPISPLTLAEMRATFAGLSQQMSEAYPFFFAGEAGDAALRGQLLLTLQAVVPGPLWPQYRALAPDFFAWLEA